MKTVQTAIWKHATSPAPDRENGVAAAFAVTIAFTAGSLAAALLLIGLSMSKVDGAIGASSQGLFEQSASLVGYAILAGLLVDCLRFLGERYFK